LFPEKRQHERFARHERFVGYRGGGKFLCLALDQGPGGAFLATSRPLSLSSRFIAVPDQDLEKRSTYLVGEVVRFRDKRPSGMGVRWLYAIGLEGKEALSAFLRDHFKVFLAADDKRRAPSASGGGGRAIYDFVRRRMLSISSQEATRLISEAMHGRVQGAHLPPPTSEAPAAPTATHREVGHAPPEPSREQSSELAITEADSDFFVANIPAFYRFEGRNRSGVIRYIVARQLVIDSNEPLPPAGKKFSVVVPAPFKTTGRGEWVFSVTTLRRLQSPTGETRVEVLINKTLGREGVEDTAESLMSLLSSPPDGE